jgi:RES domain-containing protein
VAPDQTALPFNGPGTLTAFRWSTYDVPFWARENSRPGRWHRIGDTPTQYWSLSPEAAWAELIRQENLCDESELDLVRMPFWVCRVQKASLIDLRIVDQRDRYDVTSDNLVGDDWFPCQEARTRLEADARGVIAPCPALPEHSNVTLFGARRAIRWTRQPVLATTAPATMAAIGRPPRGLLRIVRRPTSPADQDRLF